VRLAPDQQPAHLSLAIALYKQDRGQEALAAVERAIALDPEDVVTRFYQALTLSDLGSYEQALQILHQLLDHCDQVEEQARIEAEIERLHRLSND
jgi:cytochrome c-type biogenesis protein CcmH/NrfG